MEFENWYQVALIVVGLMVLWGVVGLVLRLARRVISCGCSLIIALGIFYFVMRWLAGQ